MRPQDLGNLSFIWCHRAALTQRSRLAIKADNLLVIYRVGKNDSRFRLPLINQRTMFFLGVAVVVTSRCRSLPKQAKSMAKTWRQGPVHGAPVYCAPRTLRNKVAEGIRQQVQGHRRTVNITRGSTMMPRFVAEFSKPQKQKT